MEPLVSPVRRLAGADSGSFVALQPTYSEDGGTGVIRTLFGRWRDAPEPELVFQSTRWRLIRHNSVVPQGADGQVPSGEAPARSTGSPEEGGPAPAQDADAVL